LSIGGKPLQTATRRKERRIRRGNKKGGRVRGESTFSARLLYFSTVLSKMMGSLSIFTSRLLVNVSNEIVSTNLSIPKFVWRDLRMAEMV
jgi:hypothetical protein